MNRPRILPAFSKEEFARAHTLLASKVASMLGRKFEEGDWIEVYCNAKMIPIAKWSNLNIDVVHECLGVEQKMLCVESDKHIKEWCGTTRMHPAATRSIRIPSTEGDATEMARNVLEQYGDLIRQRTKSVSATCLTGQPDMRVGWLLWQESLQEFLYFEEEMLIPDPNDFFAEWKESIGGARKGSKNLWVYEKETSQKRYSITTSAGAKIQPYFDVPSPSNSNLYYFRVQGEPIDGGLVRIWVTVPTALILKQFLGDLDKDALSQAILHAAGTVSTREATEDYPIRTSTEAKPVLMTGEAYQALTRAFNGVSDEHMMQLFIQHLAK